MPEDKLFARLHYSKLLLLELQRRLQALGLDPGPVNGRWNPETEAALEEAQRAYGVHGGKAQAAYFVVIPGASEELHRIA